MADDQKDQKDQKEKGHGIDPEVLKQAIEEQKQENQQRLKGFMEELQALQEKYGVDLVTSPIAQPQVIAQLRE